LRLCNRVALGQDSPENSGDTQEALGVLNDSSGRSLCWAIQDAKEEVDEVSHEQSYGLIIPISFNIGGIEQTRNRCCELLSQLSLGHGRYEREERQSQKAKRPVRKCVPLNGKTRRLLPDKNLEGKKSCGKKKKTKRNQE